MSGNPVLLRNRTPFGHFCEAAIVLDLHFRSIANANMTDQPMSLAMAELVVDYAFVEK